MSLVEKAKEVLAGALARYGTGLTYVPEQGEPRPIRAKMSDHGGIAPSWVEEEAVFDRARWLEIIVSADEVPDPARDKDSILEEDGRLWRVRDILRLAPDGVGFRLALSRDERGRP